MTNIKVGVEVKGVDSRHIWKENWRLMGTTGAVAAEQEGDEIRSKSEAVPFDRTQKKTGCVNAPNVGVVISTRAFPPLWGLGRVAALRLAVRPIVRSSHHSLVHPPPHNFNHNESPQRNTFRIKGNPPKKGILRQNVSASAPDLNTPPWHARGMLGLDFAAV